MADPDLRDEISRLETHIEELAEVIERCRKIIQVSKVVIAAGGIWMLGTIFGAMRFDPAAVIAAMTAMIGGTVIFGSTTTTSKQTSATMNDAEAHRVALIGSIELRVVEDGLAEPAGRPAHEDG